MKRYFKIVEINYDTFTNATVEYLDCIELISPDVGCAYVAIDDNEEYEMRIPLDCFD